MTMNASQIDQYGWVSFQFFYKNIQIVQFDILKLKRFYYLAIALNS